MKIMHRDDSTLLNHKGILYKLALVVLLVVGGGNFVWADDPYVNKLTFENNSIPSGWSDLSGNSNYVNYSGDYITTNGNYTLVKLTSSDKINLVSGQQIVIVAQTNRIGTTNYDGISYQHGANTSAFSNSTGTLYAGTTNFSSTDTDCTITISIDSDQNEYIAFWFYGRIKIKSIDFQASSGGSSTPAPTSFSYSDVTYNSASLSWTAGGEETQWQIRYNANSDFDPANEEGTLIDYSTVTNPYTLSGLTESTTYYAYVRAYIDEDTQSDWAGPVSFTTLEQYPTPTSLTIEGLTGTTATFSWSNGEGTTPTAWELQYSEDEDFSSVTDTKSVTTNPYTLTGLTAGTTYYARIRGSVYGGESHNSGWSDAISFTPTTVWENFSSGIPSTWHNSGFLTNRSGYSDMAFSTNINNFLITPRLHAEEGETLSFDISFQYTGSAYKLIVQYSTDRISWNDADTYTSTGVGSFTAPSTGDYWLKFNANYCGVDNFRGFSLAEASHDMALGDTTIPTTGTSHGDYTASVILYERGGMGEEYTAELYYDGEKVAESSSSINGNRDKTVSLTFTPTEINTADVYIKVSYNNGTELTTDSRSVTISETTYIFDESGIDDNAPIISTSSVAKLKYSAQKGWNTICVPFTLTDYMDKIFGTGWTAYVINSYANGELVFTKTNSFEFSMPYLVNAPNAVTNNDFIYLKGVVAGSYNWSHSRRTQTKGDASFIGTFDPIAAPGMDGKYGITKGGKLGKGNSLASIKGYRAYLEIAGETPARIVMIDDDGGTTDLGFLNLVDEDAKDIYNLKGQKVQKAGKGIYIVNGKKVVIK